MDYVLMGKEDVEWEKYLENIYSMEWEMKDDWGRSCNTEDYLKIGIFK